MTRVKFPTRGRTLLLTNVLAVSLATTACAPPPTAPAARTEPAPAAPARPTNVTIAIPSEPSGMSDKLFQAASDIHNLFEASFSYLDDTDSPRPLLAERLPTQADGTWVVNADGTMRTTYTLK